MIKLFEMADLDNFKPNSFSDPQGALPQLQDDDFWNYSLINGETKVIVSFKHNGNNDWAGYFLVSENVSLSDIKDLRRFMKHCIVSLHPRTRARLWTASVDCPLIERWHNFLGMKKVRPIKIKDKDCMIWEMSWE